MEQRTINTAELLKKVRTIALKTRGISNNLFAGEYHSAFKGRGMSFAEVREYQYGDDVRNIDWNVTARYQKPFIKTYEEERELTLMLLVDTSPSAYFGTHGGFKNEYIAEICAVLAFSALSNNDKVGLILFGSGIDLYIPPKKGRFHALRIIRELLNHKPTPGGTEVGHAIRFFSNVTKKRSIAFLISDFMCNGFANPLSIACRRHDITGIHVYDREERDLPEVGLLRFIDAETGAMRWLDSDSLRVRTALRQAFDKNLERVKMDFTKNGSSLISLSTGDSYTKALHKFFKNRDK
jgi:uncharacterized protein (DUF58 family)